MSAIVGKLDGAPVYQDRDVPLTRRKKDGTKEPALCWLVGGAVLVHPERWEAFLRAFGEELSYGE